MLNRLLFDTSAIFTFTDDEPGASKVEKFLDNARSNKKDTEILVSLISLTELRYVTLQEYDEDKVDYLTAIVKSWPVSWIAPDEKICLAAATLKARYQISLADSFIAATAIIHDCDLVHKDPEFDYLKGLLRMIHLPYKAKEA